MNNVETFRLALLSAGYHPIPVNGKAPRLDGWQKLTDATREDIVGWTTQRRHETNTGVLTRGTPALDVDISDQAAADAVERLVRDRFADCGVLLTRFGKAPKRAIPFRTDRPFKKITALLVAPGPGGEIHRLEFLGDGQQFVVDGIHPDTRRPYSWIGGELGAVGRDALPSIDETEAHRLVDDAVELLVAEHGYRLKEKTQPRSEDRPPPGGEPRPGDVGPRERAYAEAALRGRAAELAAMAPKTGRNAVLLRAATRLGTMVVAGWIDARVVEDELAAAAEATGKSGNNVRQTIANGLRYGAQYPARSLDDADAAFEAAVAAANQADGDVRESMFGANGHDREAKASTGAEDDETRPLASTSRANGKTNSGGEARSFAPGDGAKKPLLLIESGNLPAVAKELAALFAANNHFLSNSHAPAGHYRIAADRRNRGSCRRTRKPSWRSGRPFHRRHRHRPRCNARHCGRKAAALAPFGAPAERQALI
jgi:hypothetical protein